MVTMEEEEGAEEEEEGGARRVVSKAEEEEEEEEEEEGGAVGGPCFCVGVRGNEKEMVKSGLFLLHRLIFSPLRRCSYSFRPALPPPSPPSS